MSWEAVIGLEVHAQLLTASKLFCGCSTRFGEPPNANTCPVCAGFPGMLPVLNAGAVDLAVRVGLACGCEIAERAIWARKNYFYPDLPKGYQISMYDAPLCIGGTVPYLLDGEERRARLTRIHMEEDAGKSLHDADATASLVDLNRTGVPLLEIVSEPDLRGAAEAAAYLRSLRSTLQYLEVCDGNMEEGSFRCDANVSVRRHGESAYGTRVEIKNMNSFRSVERAIDHEIRRQIELVEEGGTVVQETRLWDADRDETRSMRSKEEAHDYRYFPEPDLPPLEVPRARVEEIRSHLPELPLERRRRWETTLGLSAADVEVLTARRDLGDYFETALAAHANAKSLANWVMESILRVVRERRLDEALRIEAWPVPAAELAALVALIDRGTISGKIAKTVFDDMVETGKSAETIVRERGLVQVSDVGTITEAVERVLAEHADKVAEYRAGKEKLFGFFVGQAMKATGGKANPKLLNELLRKHLAGE